MVASQCAIPLTPLSHHGHYNIIGTKLPQFLPKATCLGTILKNSGYSLTYMGGADIRFSGKDRFYNAHGFTRVLGKDELFALYPHLERNRVSRWGLYDDVLLDLAYQEFHNLTKTGNSPVGLFLLTLDTHFPEGFISPSCKDISYLSGGNPILNAVSCSDHLIGKFVERIRLLPQAKDTLIIISSDHLANKNTAMSQLQQGWRRNLFMVLNSGFTPKEIATPSTMLDVAPTLLHLIGFERTGFALGRSLLGEEQTLTQRLPNLNDKIQNDWVNDLRSFWDLPEFIDKIKVWPDKEQIEAEGLLISSPLLLTLTKGSRVDELALENFYPLSEEIGKTSHRTLIVLDKCWNLFKRGKLAIAETAPPNSQCLFSQGPANPHGSLLPIVKHSTIRLKDGLLEQLSVDEKD
jgi:phosphoglycerol transferase